MSAKDNVVFYPSRVKSLLFFLLSGGLVAACVWLWTLPDPDVSTMEWLIIAATGIFFGWSTLYFLYRLLIRKPLLIVSKEGMYDNGSAMNVGFLKWSEIEGYVVYSYLNQKMLGIVPKDVEETLKKVHVVKRKGMEMNLAMQLPPINIPLTMFTVKEEALLKVLTRFAPEKLLQIDEGNK